MTAPETWQGRRDFPLSVVMPFWLLPKTTMSLIVARMVPPDLPRRRCP
jgi:hypothetical protein